MDNCCLNYTQVMMLIHGIKDLRKNNINFNDDIATYFENYAVERTAQIAIDKIKFKLYSNRSYIIPRQVVDYLVDITNINIYDIDTINNYKFTIKMEEEKIIKNGLNNVKTKKKN